MSTDATWKVGTGVEKLAVFLAVLTLLSGRFDSIESRINVMENRLDARLLSIKERLRAAPARRATRSPLLCPSGNSCVIRWRA